MSAAKPYLEQRRFGDNVTSAAMRSATVERLQIAAPIPGSPEYIRAGLTPVLQGWKASIEALPCGVRLVATSIFLSVVLDAAAAWLGAVFGTDGAGVVVRVFDDVFALTKERLSMFTANHALLVRLHDDIVNGDEWPWMMPAHIEALNVARFRGLAIEEKLAWLRRLRGRCASKKTVTWCKSQAAIDARRRTGPGEPVPAGGPVVGTESAVLAATLQGLLGPGAADVQAARAAIRDMYPLDQLVAISLLVEALAKNLRLQTLPVKVEVLRRLDGRDGRPANVQKCMTDLMDGPVWDAPRKWALPA